MSEVAEDHLRLAEALIFASAEPVPARSLTALLPEDQQADTVLHALQARYAGRGVELVEAAGGWHQPVTRAQIEEIRGAALSQQTLDALLEASLIRPAGHREVPGRPTLWATTPAFLVQFGLSSLGELPKRDDLVLENK